ncbi:MAG: trypsin-like peptidase domain-containing protein [Anaerolineae bacterium]|jgi:2-alkenal reductase|nr:trypsin-like peptidase domain-containing protein [Anaerolineae bacterium]
MKNIRIGRLASVAMVVILGLAACAPLSTETGRIGTTKGSPQGVTTGRELASTLTERVDVVPVVQPATPEVETKAASADAATVLQDTLVTLYKEVNPSVVYIAVTSGGSGFAASGGSGSGFVYDEDGYIVTNSHVVAAGNTYEVVFSNGDRQNAELIGTDLDSDLAVLKVAALPDGVKAVTLASAPVEVGQYAVAIGSPFGEQGTMTLGIVSGLGRSLPSQRTTTTGSTYSLPQVIQTDAPINPGNSGGPLLNLEGEVIGVNAAIASTSGTGSGVGFSIPIDVVKRVAPSLIEDGEVTYSYMGVSFDGEITLADMELYGVSQTQGAYVISVTPGGPADEAGLVGADVETGKGGDLIIEIDGRPIQNFSDLNTYLVLETEPGQVLEITVLRGDEPVTLSVTLGARP